MFPGPSFEETAVHVDPSRDLVAANPHRASYPAIAMHHGARSGELPSRQPIHVNDKRAFRLEIVKERR